jgi:ketosteroid isomerase-like protein
MEFVCPSTSGGNQWHLQLQEKGQDVVVLHVREFSSIVNGTLSFLANGETVSGKPYNNEYMFTFRFHGEKIAIVKEFMDSKYVTDVLKGEAKAREEKDS